MTFLSAHEPREVLGAQGFGDLRWRLDRKHRIILLVDRQAQHVFTPSFPWMMLGWREPPEITRDLKRLEHKGIEVVRDEIREMDAARLRVRTEQQELSGDHLIIALGAEARLRGVPGLAEAGYNLYDLNGALRLRDALRGFRGGRVVILIAGLPFKCPAAPEEASMLTEAWLKDRGLRERAQMDIHTTETLPTPSTSPRRSTWRSGSCPSRTACAQATISSWRSRPTGFLRW